jgi:RNA polymerase sigma factor (sigma-70 family)
VKRLSLRLGGRRGHSAEGFAAAGSFEALILPHLDSAYNLARFLTRDAALSDDVVQDAMLRAFRAFGEFRRDSPRAWLLAIVRNCCRSAMTARGAAAVRLVQEESAETDAHPDPADDPEQALMRASDAAAVRSLVEALPEPFREALVLRELDELSYRVIAEVTGVAMGTVM